MSIDIERLKNVVKKANKIVAQCPACAAEGHDKEGNHLAIFPDGAYHCIKHQNNREHSKKIAQLSGGKGQKKRPMRNAVVKKVYPPSTVIMVIPPPKRQPPTPTESPTAMRDGGEKVTESGPDCPKRPDEPASSHSPHQKLEKSCPDCPPDEKRFAEHLQDSKGLTLPLPKEEHS